MEHLGFGLVTLVNGAFTLVDAVANPFAVGGGLLAAGLFWLARLEVDDLDRRGYKPMIAPH